MDVLSDGKEKMANILDRSAADVSFTDRYFIADRCAGEYGYCQDHFVLLRDLVPLWFKKSNPDINKKFSFPYAGGDDDAPGVAL